MKKYRSLKPLDEDEIIAHIDRAINELVYDKTQLIKAYNYYHGKRDPEQFRHLEENYGIGTSTSVAFIPLVKKHIDVLIGEYLSTPLLPRVSCKDAETLSKIFDQKQKMINNELKQKVQNVIFTGDQGKSQEDLQNEMQKLQDHLDQHFISEFEIAGQNIVDWAIQSRNIDFLNKRKTMLTDLAVSGTTYYRTLENISKDNLNCRVLNPLNTFIDRNPDSPYLKDSPRAVIRDYLTKDQILAKYGHLLDSDNLDELDSMEEFAVDGTTTYLRSVDSVAGNTVTDGILGGFEITPLLPFERNTSRYFRLYPVYEIEWLHTEKENNQFIVYRYEGVRINNNIYIPTGKSKNVVRTSSDPNNCTLTINGIFYSDRNGDPFSLVLATADLQD